MILQAGPQGLRLLLCGGRLPDRRGVPTALMTGSTRLGLRARLCCTEAGPVLPAGWAWAPLECGLACLPHGERRLLVRGLSRLAERAA